jgi:hypothetical protein
MSNIHALKAKAAEDGSYSGEDSFYVYDLFRVSAAMLLVLLGCLAAGGAEYAATVP